MPGNNELLWSIISKNPSGVVLFEALDLWLQRRAVLAFYDRNGIEPFLNKIKVEFQIRMELLEFLVGARTMTAKDKGRLMISLNRYQSEFSGTADEWYWAGDPKTRLDYLGSDN